VGQAFGGPKSSHVKSLGQIINCRIEELFATRSLTRSKSVI